MEGNVLFPKGLYKPYDGIPEYNATAWKKPTLSKESNGKNRMHGIPFRLPPVFS
jgi:hypothetical protein